MKYDELPTTKYANFEQWRSLGYGVIKGSKAFWIDGESYFTEHQVNSFASRIVENKLPPTEKKPEEVIASYVKPDYDDDYPF